jgi:hypothetical protein
MAAGLILECLREAQASSTGPRDRAWAGRHACGFGLSAPLFFSSFFPLPLEAIVIYIFTYIYIYIYIYKDIRKLVPLHP